MDINEFVKGLNDPRLKESIRKLGSTTEGQKILGSITPQDRQNLLKQLGNLNASGITNEMLIRQINNNPNILNQLNNIINKKR